MIHWKPIGKANSWEVVVTAWLGKAMNTQMKRSYDAILENPSIQMQKNKKQIPRGVMMHEHLKIFHTDSA